MIRKSLAQILKSLTPVNRADNVYSVANADRINAIQDALSLIAQGENIASGINVRKRSGTGYVMLSSNASGGRGGGVSFDVPWEMHVTIDSGGVYTLRINPGTINNMLPSNMFDPWTIDPFGLQYVSLDVLTDGKQVTSALINLSTTWAPPLRTTMGLAPGDFSIQLGVINHAETFALYNKVIFASPVQVMTTLKDSITPGLPIHDQWYMWDIWS